MGNFSVKPIQEYVQSGCEVVIKYRADDISVILYFRICVQQAFDVVLAIIVMQSYL